MKHFGGPTNWKRFCAIYDAKQKQKEEKRDLWFERKASQMRLNPTDLEIKLELILDSLHIKHKKQYIMAQFIVDFYLPTYNAVIEADGPLHEGFMQRRRDAKRDKKLMKRFKCKILHLRSHEFFSSEALQAKVLEFLTGIKGADLRPAAEALHEVAART